MAKSSKFFQLSSSILLEYIYADQSNLTEYRLPTSTYPIYKYVGDSVGDSYNHILLHGSKSYQTYRHESCYLKDTSNKIKRMRSLLDPDDEISLVDQAPVYDTIKIHLAQGFNYEQHGGFDLRLYLLTNNDKEVSLAQFVTYSGDSYWTMNTSPFMMSGKHYTSYIEIQVLSSFNLINDFYYGDDKTIVNAITNNGTFIEGLKFDQYLQCKFSWLDNKTVYNNIEYAAETESIIFDINTTDTYSALSAYIAESSSYDYIEYGAAYNGEAQYFEDFINSLNNNGHDYIVLHNLIVSEFINVPGSEPYWIITDSVDISQIENWGDINTFRPIIKNNSAIAYKIDYILRFYDRTDNSQILKVSSMISYDVNKYGKELFSIKLDENPTQNIIYNKNVIKQINMTRQNDTPTITSKNVLSLVTNNNIVISSQNINSLSNDVLTGSSIFDINKTYTDGAAKIVVNNTTSYIKFTISEYKNGAVTGSDISGLGTGYLCFNKDNGNRIEIIEYQDQNLNLNKTAGEILFRISEIDATKILALTNRQFSIVFQRKSDSNTIPFNNYEKVTKCGGIFYSQKEWSTIVDISISEKYKQSLDIANTTIIELNTKNAKLQSDLTTSINNANNLLSDYNAHNKTDDDLIVQLQNQIKSNQDLLNQKDEEIKKLTAKLNDISANTTIIKPNTSKNEFNDDLLPDPTIQKPIITPKSSTGNTIKSGGGCPTPDMFIQTDRNEWILADSLIPGDKVYTVHEKTGALDFYTVAYINKIYQPVLRVIAGEKIVTVSESHKFLTPDRGFIEAIDLISGDEICTLYGNIKIISIEPIGIQEVMKIEITDAHTYIVDGLISHNKQAIEKENGLSDNPRNTKAME